MGNQDITELRKGISLFYLCYVVVAESGSVRNAHEYLIVTRIAEDEDQETIARQLIDTYNRLANN